MLLWLQFVSVSIDCDDDWCGAAAGDEKGGASSNEDRAIIREVGGSFEAPPGRQKHEIVPTSATWSSSKDQTTQGELSAGHTANVYRDIYSNMALG